MEKKFDPKEMARARKKPVFIQQRAHHKKRLGKKWRRPKGLQSKLRLSKAGHGKSVSIGYRTPKKERTLHGSGKVNILVHNVHDVKKIDPEKEIITIGAVGLKNKINIVKEATGKAVKITNISDPKRFLEDVERRLKERKEKKQKQQEDKKKQQEKKKSAKEKKEKLDEKVEGNQEKKEKDKVLTKRV